MGKEAGNQKTREAERLDSKVKRRQPWEDAGRKEKVD